MIKNGNIAFNIVIYIEINIHKEQSYIRREDIEKRNFQQNKFYFVDRLIGNAINWLHALIFGYQEGYKCEMNRILDELVKNSSSCVEKMEKKEEWKRMNEDLKDIAVNSDDEGIKKLRLIFNNEVEVMKEAMKRNEDELNGMDVNGMVDNVEKVNEKVNMNDSKVYVFSDGQKKAISNELVKKYPECLLNVNMIDIDSRNNDNEIEIDFRFKYL